MAEIDKLKINIKAISTRLKLPFCEAVEKIEHFEEVQKNNLKNQ